MPLATCSASVVKQLPILAILGRYKSPAHQGQRLGEFRLRFSGGQTSVVATCVGVRCCRCWSEVGDRRSDNGRPAMACCLRVDRRPSEMHVCRALTSSLHRPRPCACRSSRLCAESICTPDAQSTHKTRTQTRAVLDGRIRKGKK